MDRTSTADFAFFPLRGYHLRDSLPVSRELEKDGYNSVFVETDGYRKGQNEVQRTAAEQGVPLLKFKDFLDRRTPCRVVVVHNDWDALMRIIARDCKARGVEVVGWVEGIQDYLDADRGHRRSAYRRVKHVILPGEFDRRYFAESPQLLHIGEVVRVREHWKARRRGPARRQTGRVLINSNFSYGVLAKHRDRWLELAVTACTEANVEPVVTRHPFDRGKLYRELETKEDFATAASKSDVVIQRFASGVLEALAVGTPVIYFNPHGEKVDKFIDSQGAYLYLRSIEALRRSLQRKHHFWNETLAMKFLRIHAGLTHDEGDQPGKRIASILGDVVATSSPATGALAESLLRNANLGSPQKLREEAQAIGALYPDASAEDEISPGEAEAVTIQRANKLFRAGDTRKALGVYRGLRKLGGVYRHLAVNIELCEKAASSARSVTTSPRTKRSHSFGCLLRRPTSSSAPHQCGADQNSAAYDPNQCAAWESIRTFDTHLQSGSRPAVSVIVPAYNAQQFLKPCLSSLIAQTLSEIEIIVVNDGSTDDSQSVIDSFVAAAPQRIRSLTKPNGGLGDARNFGVRHARGEFIGFVDSDDHVEADMFERLYRAAVRLNCDVAVGQFWRHALDGTTTIRPTVRSDENSVFTGVDYLLDNRSMVVWNKLYRRDVIEGIAFPDTWFEDVAWTPVVLSRTDRLCYVCKPLYHYIRRPGSISASHQDPRTLQGIDAIWYALRNCAERNRDAVAFVALNRLLFEARVRRGYADKYIAAIKDLQPLLRGNKYYLGADDTLRTSTARYLKDFPVIPKRVFFGHFGGAPLTTVQKACIESWTKHLMYNDGEVIRLDESNCDINEHPAVAELYREGHFDVVAEYFTLRAIVESGGIALKTNVMGRAFIAEHLVNGAIFSLSAGGGIHDGIVAGVAGHKCVQLVFERFFAMLRKGHVESTLGKAIEEQLANDYQAQLHGSTQNLPGAVKLFAADVFHTRQNASSSVSEYRPDQQRPSKAPDLSPGSTRTRAQSPPVRRRLQACSSAATPT